MLKNLLRLNLAIVLLSTNIFAKTFIGEKCVNEEIMKLHKAIIEGNEREAIRSFLGGARFDYEDYYGRNGIENAARKGMEELVRLMLTACDDDLNRPYWTELAFEALIKERYRYYRRNDINISLLKFLLKEGENLANCYLDGYHPLDLACKYGDSHLVHILLKHGANLSYQTKYCKTPLEFAETSGDESTIEMIKTALFLQERNLKCRYKSSRTMTF